MEKQISSEEMFHGVIFQVTKDQVMLDDGRTTRRDVVHHHGGVGILALQERKILLVKQYRYSAKQELWEISAGKLEQGEDPYVCGLRELEEETAHRATIATPICCFYSTPGFCSEQIYLYQCDTMELVSDPLPMDEHEQIETAWFSIPEAYRMIQEGGIIDGKTIIAIQHAYIQYLQSK